MAIIDRPVTTSVPESPDVVVDDLVGVVARLQEMDLESLSAQELLDLTKALEVARRRLDAGTDRIAGHLDRSGAYSIDGHRTAKAAIKHLGRLSGAEAHCRVRNARALRRLPEVSDAATAGRIPSASMRAIGRAASNPRVADHLPTADPFIARMATELPHDDFVAWLAQWERMADADGAAQDAEFAHQRRTVSLVENGIDGTWHLRGTFGAVQGAAIKQVLDTATRAETEADQASARARHGDGARDDQLERTPAQRRADATVEVFRRYGAVPADAKTPKPLVNIVIDQQTFEDELRRSAGTTVDTDPERADARCATLDGTSVPPPDAVAAALVGHVRRVVVDARSNVIDLGRRRRLFTGSSRDAVMLQGLLHGHAGLRCPWPGCDIPAAWLDADHREPAARGGPTDVANGLPLCGTHNRLKERGFVPVRGPDGTWTILRPDGTPITPAL